MNELERVARERGIRPGRLGRYARDDIEGLANDTELAEQVRGDRLLGPDQAAEHLEIRRVDFDYAVAAGWVTAHTHTDRPVGRRRWITVPLYRTADVDDLRDLPGVDWEAVRSCRPGDASPLREFTTLPTTRAALVRGFTADLADRYELAIDASYDDTRDRWELRWTPDSGGEPSRETVRAALRADPDLAVHERPITLRPTSKEHT